ncbi:MAG: M28 family peptidase [Pirellulales bacterium]
MARIWPPLFVLFAGSAALAMAAWALLSSPAALWEETAAAQPLAAGNQLTLADIPFDGEQAYNYLKQISDLGGRISGSEGMAAQQKLLTEHFTKLGGKVRLQQFRVRHPQTAEPVTMGNLIVEWHPERKERILLAAHYDTRPLPDQDLENPQGKFVGANDGASGVALLMELGKHMAKFPGPVGVDFVLFDGEEFVWETTHPYFLGSEWFARDYKAHPPGHKYRWGVLLDMVADADLQLMPDHFSLNQPKVRPLCKQIWQTAQRLGVNEFSPRAGYQILDDHIKLNDLGGIPSCDLIDFDYPHWHTQGDTADKCSALSLAKVGWVLNEWLKTQTGRAAPAAGKGS